MSRSTTLGWALVAWAAIVTAIRALPYALGSPARFDPLFRDGYVAHLGAVHLHAVGACLALVLGPVALWPELRTLAPRLHRIVGLVYAVGVGVAGTSGLSMAMRARGGADLAFLVLATTWLVCTGVGLSAAVRRDLVTHRRWAIRSYALTFGAVMLRVYLAAATEWCLDFDRVYPWAIWGAWLTTGVLVELGLARRARQPLAHAASGGQRLSLQGDPALSALTTVVAERE